MDKEHYIYETVDIKSKITLDDLIEHFTLRAEEAKRPYDEYWAGLLQYDVAALDVFKRMKESEVHL